MDKKKLFKVLDIVLMLVFLVPVLFPEKIDAYINIWVMIIILFAMLAYYAIKSKVTNEPVLEPSWRRTIVRLICLLAMFLIDILLHRFGAYSILLPFEALTAIMAGEIFCEVLPKKKAE